MVTERGPFSGGAEVEAPREDRAGEVLDGKYRLVQKVGEGGMGEVYEAEHVQLGRRFAVKVLHPELLASSRMLRRFSREVLAVSRLESDHLVPALDCGYTPQGGPYYVMEFLRGEDLRKVLHAQAPLATRRAVKLVIDACRGLALAHGSGLVHRDLKPENVFVVSCDNGEERARVLDFGLVQVHGGTSSTRLGSLVGTVRYMAPEQARTDSSIDQRADVYALGAILYECLCGKPPHAGDSAEEVLFNRMNRKPESLLELRPGLPDGLERCIEKALAHAPSDRFADALELARALLPYAGPDVGALETPHALRAPDEPPRAELTYDLEEAAAARRPARRVRPRLAAVIALSSLAAVSATHLVDRFVLREASRPAPAPTATTAQVSPGAPVVRPVEEEPNPPRPALPPPVDPQPAAKPVEARLVSTSTAPRTSAVAPYQRAGRRESTGDDLGTPSSLFDSNNPYVRSQASSP